MKLHLATLSTYFLSYIKSYKPTKEIRFHQKYTRRRLAASQKEQHLCWYKINEKNGCNSAWFRPYFRSVYGMKTLINIVSWNAHQGQTSLKAKKNSSPSNIMQIINILNDSHYEYLVTAQLCNKKDLCIGSCLKEHYRHSSG